MDEEKKKEALKPFQEKATEAELYIDEIREKLGEEKATEINDSLINLKTAILGASEVHETTVVENLTTQEKNRKLADVNNELYIKNSESLKGKNVKPPTELDLDEDDALDAFADAAVGK